MESKKMNADHHYHKKNRQRGDNWTEEEKGVLIKIMAESSAIVDNRGTDTNTNKRKYLEWLRVRNKLREVTGKHREIAQVKGFWRRLKLNAKKYILQHNKALLSIGGGQQPSPPPDEEQIIKNMCPTDFTIGANQFDSNGVVEIKVEATVEEENADDEMIVTPNTDKTDDHLDVKDELVQNDPYPNQRRLNRKKIYLRRTIEEDDECDIFGKLIAKKLKKLPEEKRENMMFEMLSLFRSTNVPSLPRRPSAD